ncbi:cobalamin biosynthesis protein [Actinobacteria bacterium YIM 96077]|uniref:Cobalamin biosynthesis protein CobD n=1 Tax=Phytoactinopolyspora halophila TaxID=1981511 RepID=A0A329QRG2_9ACTN|nr:cobalamin biosynthesis protein [Phytoactinopolyspora halophila]AYY15035.1 cobalamin biosynthesis protein [Actinobacteria bacterium YIM 96077]RAW14199.1 cobalamin biosynthesis protein [Phytoactinopolyspora halophila]
MSWTTTAGLAVGTAADALLGDPRRGHPVAGFGRAAASLERAWWSDSRGRGAAYATVAVGVPVVTAAIAERMLDRTIPHTVATAATTWAVLGGRSLTREAELLGRSLADHDLDAARRRLPHLCGRDPATLDADGLARATVESLAENTSDAVVAPLVWGAVAGLPGLVGYRAVNTLDAMVGHKSERYRHFGWASARLDDAANYLPARLAGALTMLAAPLVGGCARDARRAWRRDAHRHPSPNAGVVEAALAGALGRRLGGRTVYPYGVDDRPVLGSGPAATAADIPRAVRISRAVSLGTLATVTAARVGASALRKRKPAR